MWITLGRRGFWRKLGL
ncbi:hypothetical protein LINGRAHAP2_LOCUS6632 [Linum grandiflorum]